jgi:hypothetical protein
VSGRLASLPDRTITRVSTAQATARDVVAAQPQGAVGIDEALRAAVSGRAAVGPSRIEGAAIVVIHFAFDAHAPRFVAAVGRRRAVFVLDAALRAGSRCWVARLVARAILIESALHAAMQRGIATGETARLAVDIGHAFEAGADLQVTSQRNERAILVPNARTAPSTARRTRLPARTGAAASAAGARFRGIEFEALVAAERSQQGQVCETLHGLATICSASDLPKPPG